MNSCTCSDGGLQEPLHSTERYLALDSCGCNEGAVAEASNATCNYKLSFCGHSSYS